VSQKLDMLGIGMQHHQNDPNGIAWRQNRDFENLLQRLNNGTEAIGSFHKARGSSPSEGEEVAAEVVDSVRDADGGADATKLEKKKKKQKKRKALQEEEEESARDKRERKKRKKAKSDVAPADDTSPSLEAQAAATTASELTPVPVASIAAPAPIRALYVAGFRLVLNSRTYFLSTLRQPTRPPRPHHRSQVHGRIQLCRARRNSRHPVVLIFYRRHRSCLSISAHQCYRRNDPDPNSPRYVRRSRRRPAAETDDGGAVGRRLPQGEAWRESVGAAPAEIHVRATSCHSRRGQGRR
jgi:hypothetical protein